MNDPKTESQIVAVPAFPIPERLIRKAQALDEELRMLLTPEAYAKLQEAEEEATNRILGLEP